MTKIFVNGTFDLLHAGHIYLLQYAKSLGDYLLVAIDTDERVKDKKGEFRPILSEKERWDILRALKPVNNVIAFDSDKSLEKIIKDYSPDIMVVGSDWKGKEIIGGKYAKKIVYFDRIQQYSTTNIIQKIKKNGRLD